MTLAIGEGQMGAVDFLELTWRPGMVTRDPPDLFPFYSTQEPDA